MGGQHAIKVSRWTKKTHQSHDGLPWRPFVRGSWTHLEPHITVAASARILQGPRSREVDRGVFCSPHGPHPLHLLPPVLLRRFRRYFHSRAFSATVFGQTHVRGLDAGHISEREVAPMVGFIKATLVVLFLVTLFVLFLGNPWYAILP